MPLTGKEMIKLLKKHGYKEVRVTGSHHIMKKDDTRVVIPVHGNKDLSKGLEQKILNDAKLQKEK